MNNSAKTSFDLRALAENGLRRGRTTGSCATAAVKAAVQLLEQGVVSEMIEISLPDSLKTLAVPVETVEFISEGVIKAEVIKDAGDDPDNTDGAKIVCIVKRNNLGVVRFFAGEGVGKVTEPGLRIPIGEPAINPVPRQMIKDAVDEVLSGATNPGYDIEIGCENGEQIAKKTFNPRLGIVGGISILGTSGIVEPMSLAAYMASIEVYIRVALGDHPSLIAFMPGNIGIKFAKEKLGLSKKAIVQIANFIGFSIDSAEMILREEIRELDTLWILGHPGKLAKILDDIWDTHSSKSGMAMQAVARVAEDLGMKANLIREANTVEAVLEIIPDRSESKKLWTEIEKRVAAKIKVRASHINNVEVRFFSMNGTPLGQAA
jgi:cobalt-precorrin-5B (C1)-methyltransferase